MNRLHAIRPILIAIASLALLAVPMAGCATSNQDKVSSQAYAKPQKTISAARALGAEDLPRAKLYLSYARDGVAQADRAIQQGQTDSARLALSRAQADANLALTLTQQRQMAQQVQQINKQIEELGQQIGD